MRSVDELRIRPSLQREPLGMWLSLCEAAASTLSSVPGTSPPSSNPLPQRQLWQPVQPEAKRAGVSAYRAGCCRLSEDPLARRRSQRDWKGEHQQRWGKDST